MADSGFVKAHSGNIPKVDSFMIADFFSGNEDFVGAELRSRKIERSGRENYGDSAVGYVQIKRYLKVCTVMAKVTPEHRVKSKSYNVEVTINEEEEKVINALCHDCAASSGGCKHAVCLLMWVHRRSEDPAPTSTECYWKRSKLADIGKSMKYILAKNLSPGTCTAAPKVSKDFLQKVIETGKDKEAKGQIFKHYLEVGDINQLSLNVLGHKFIENGGGTFEDFRLFCSHKMSETVLKEASRATVRQAKISLWHKLRYGRITASKMHEASVCSTLEGSLVEQILGARTPETLPMKRGCYLEPQVFEVLEEELGYSFEKTGIVLSKDFPFLAASPDAISEEFVVEIKCPSTKKNKEHYVSQDGHLKPRCNAQIHLQMKLCGKSKGILCVAEPDFESSRNINVYNVDYCESYINSSIEKAMNFWRLAIFPIVSKQK